MRGKKNEDQSGPSAAAPGLPPEPELERVGDRHDLHDAGLGQPLHPLPDGGLGEPDRLPDRRVRLASVRLQLLDDRLDRKSVV